jgi:ABC-type glycerol-3-phosphate transport system substrate-binding protein
VDKGALVLPGLAIAVACGIFASERLVQTPERTDRVRVVYWEKWTDFEFDAMKAVVDEFNRSQDRIYVDILSISNIEDKTLMAISGGIPPDVAGLYGSRVAQYADSRAVIALDELAAANDIRREQYVPVFWDIGVIRGKLYSLPSTPATIALHFNRKMFVEAGLNPDRPPETTDDLLDYAEKVTVRGQNGRLDKSGFLPTEPGWWNWSWGYFFGGRLWDGEGRITINEAENVRAYDWTQVFAKRYGAGALQTFRSGFGNFNSPQNGFMAGKVAMVSQGVWMYNFITKYAPEMDWAVAPFPYPTGRPDLAMPTIADEDVLCIPRGAKHPEEAFEFIKFVQSQKGMELLCMGQKKQTPLRKVSPEFLANHPNPYVDLFIKLSYSPNAATTPKLGVWPEYESEINAAFDSIMLNEKTPQQALDEVAKRMQPKLDTYLRRLRQRGEL